MSSAKSEQDDHRIDPHGRIWIKIVDKGSLVTIRPWGSLTERTISYATWITWERRS